MDSKVALVLFDWHVELVAERIIRPNHDQNATNILALELGQELGQNGSQRARVVPVETPVYHIASSSKRVGRFAQPVPLVHKAKLSVRVAKYQKFAPFYGTSALGIGTNDRVK